MLLLDSLMHLCINGPDISNIDPLVYETIAVHVRMGGFDAKASLVKKGAFKIENVVKNIERFIQHKENGLYFGKANGVNYQHTPKETDYKKRLKRQELNIKQSNILINQVLSCFNDNNDEDDDLA